MQSAQGYVWVRRGADHVRKKSWGSERASACAVSIWSNGIFERVEISGAHEKV